jgi:hypothetical protein
MSDPIAVKILSYRKMILYLWDKKGKTYQEYKESIIKKKIKFSQIKINVIDIK